MEGLDRAIVGLVDANPMSSAKDLFERLQGHFSIELEEALDSLVAAGELEVSEGGPRARWLGGPARTYFYLHGSWRKMPDGALIRENGTAMLLPA